MNFLAKYITTPSALLEMEPRRMFAPKPRDKPEGAEAWG